MGAVFYHQGHLAEAKAAYEKAIKLFPEFALAHYNLGALFYYDLDFDAEAEKEFRETVRIAPGFAAAHAHLGLILCDKKDFDDAEDELLEALELDDDLWLAHLGLGYLYSELGDASRDEISYKDAVNHLDKAIEKSLRDKTSRTYIDTEVLWSYIYGIRGYVNGQLGLYKEARADFINAIKSNPKDLKNKRNLRRVDELLKQRRVPHIVSIFTIILGVASFLTFIISFQSCPN